MVECYISSSNINYLTMNENTTLWTSTSEMEAGIERLKSVNDHDLGALNEINEQLNINPTCHPNFIKLGGLQVTIPSFPLKLITPYFNFNFKFKFNLNRYYVI